MEQTHPIVILPNKAQAEVFLEAIQALLRDYGLVTLADVLDLADQAYMKQDHDIGWKSLEGVEITREKTGFGIRLPYPINL